MGQVTVLYQRELHDEQGVIADNRIVLRTATSLEGPWSEAVTVIDMADPVFRDMHCCTGSTCPGEEILRCDQAGLYGTHALPHPVVTPTGDSGFGVELTFLASTWVPYNVVMFSTDVALTPSGA